MLGCQQRQLSRRRRRRLFRLSNTHQRRYAWPSDGRTLTRSDGSSFVGARQRGKDSSQASPQRGRSVWRTSSRTHREFSIAHLLGYSCITGHELADTIQHTSRSCRAGTMTIPLFRGHMSLPEATAVTEKGVVNGSHRREPSPAKSKPVAMSILQHVVSRLISSPYATCFPASNAERLSKDTHNTSPTEPTSPAPTIHHRGSTDSSCRRRQDAGVRRQVWGMNRSRAA